MTTHSKALAAIPVVSALLATLLTACAGGGGSPSIEAMAPPPPAPQQQSSNGCPASSSDLSGLIGCSLARIFSPGGNSGGSSTPAFSFPATNPLNYASWGPWAEAGGITASPTGTMTSPVAIPHSGTADYAGYASANVTYQSTWGVGQMRDYTSQGTAAVHVDFGDASVRATISLPTVEHDIPDFAYALPTFFTGSVEGNKYGGSRVDQSSIPFRHVNEFSGAFFGPAASETAGTFSARTFLQDKEVSTIQGSFGAKLCTPGTAGC